jgi:CDP-glycerol glycerophosphotransferase (TagB/SpsB family)
LQNRNPESDRVHWDSAADNYEALKHADILISDYSGVIYDYAFVFERPVLYTPAPDIDLSASDYSWIDERHWNTDVLPKIGRQLDKDNFGNLKEVIREMVSSEYDKESIREARDYCWQNRGHAAEKVVDYLINKYSELNR